MKKKLKVLVLFDGTSPTKIDQDFSKEMKTKDWKTEADVMGALGKLGHTAEHLAIYDDVRCLQRDHQRRDPVLSASTSLTTETIEQHHDERLTFRRRRLSR